MYLGCLDYVIINLKKKLIMLLFMQFFVEVPNKKKNMYNITDRQYSNIEYWK